MLVIPVVKWDEFRLEPIVADDQEFIFRGLSHPGVIQYYGVSFESFEQTASQMEFYDTMVREHTGMPWKILVNNVPVGVVSAYHYQPAHERMELGYWLLPEAQGRGIMSEVLPRILQVLPVSFKLHRLEATVETGNMASARLLEKLGFKQEGLLRNYEIKNGKRISLFVYSILLDN